MELAPWLLYYPEYLDGIAQQNLLARLREIIRGAPLFTPRMPRTGKAFSVRMTNCGPLGWMSDKEKGYRYESRHPEIGAPWPPIPQMLLDAWDALTGYPKPPEACAR